MFNNNTVSPFNHEGYPDLTAYIALRNIEASMKRNTIIVRKDAQKHRYISYRRYFAPTKKASQPSCG